MNDIRAKSRVGLVAARRTGPTDEDADMKKRRSIALAIVLAAAFAACGHGRTAPVQDWLIDPSPYKAAITEADAGRTLVMDNGLIRRTLRLAPNCATVDYRNLITGEAVIRAVRPRLSSRSTASPTRSEA